MRRQRPWDAGYLARLATTVSSHPGAQTGRACSWAPIAWLKERSRASKTAAGFVARSSTFGLFMRVTATERDRQRLARSIQPREGLAGSERTTDRSMLAIVGRPVSAMAISSSLRRMLTTARTPAAPEQASP